MHFSYVNKTIYLLWNLHFFKMVPPKINFFLFSKLGPTVAQQTSIPVNFWWLGDDTELTLVAQTVKNLPEMQETQVDPWVKKVPWGREWLYTPVLYCCLENSMDRGAWWATVLGVTKSWTKSVPSGSFHKPLILIHQREDRMKTTITEN